MKKNPDYQQWVRTVTAHMPHLSKPQAVVLAMWSFGMVMTGSCGLTTVAVFLAALLGKKENSVRQQLREWDRSRQDKKGNKRAELDVTSCFAPLLQWVLSGWSPQEKSIVLALDASTLSSRFTLLVVSVVYRGCGIPVAWKAIAANAKGSWKPYWLDLLSHLRNTIPSDWFVLVMADRGLYAKWLYEDIQQQGWHPFLRINQQGQFRQLAQDSFRPLTTVASQLGQRWSGRVICFASNPLGCTLLARWDEGYSEPWLIVTDIEPYQAESLWYGMRSWIECLFKDIKRGGWQWHQTKMTDPLRAERHWLAIAIATLWVVSVGGESDAHLSPINSETPEQLPRQPLNCQNSDTGSSAARVLSCFRRGLLLILAAVGDHLPLPLGQFFPDFSPSPPVLSSA